MRPLIPTCLALAYLALLCGFGVHVGRLSHLDLGSFYWGADLAFRQHHSPYDIDALARIGGATGHRVFPYLYPPPSLLLFFPLTFLSYGGAQVAMVVVNHVCLLAIVYVLFVRILRFTPREVCTGWLPGLLLLYLLSSRAVALTIDYGQVNLIVLALLCLTWWAMDADAPPWAIALPLALATLLKTYPAIFLVLLLLQGRRAAIAWTIGLLVLATAVAWGVLPRDSWGDFAIHVAPTGGYCRVPHGLGSPAVEANQGINGFVSRLCLDTPAGPPLVASRSACVALGYAMALVVLGGTILACRASIRRGALGAVHMQFAAFLVVSFLIAPLAWEHHLTYVAPAVIVAIVWAVRSGAGRWQIALLCVVGAMIAWPLPLNGLSLSRGPMLLVQSRKLFPVMALWGVVVMRLHELGRAPARGLDDCERIADSAPIGVVRPLPREAIA